MATPVTNITVPQATNFSKTYTYTESGITTGAASMMKHVGATTSTSFTVGINTSTSVVTLSLTPSQTIPLAGGRYYYDVLLENGTTGNISRLVEGMVDLTAGVTTTI